MGFLILIALEHRFLPFLFHNITQNFICQVFNTVQIASIGINGEIFVVFFSLKNFRLHVSGSSGVPHTSRGRILQSKILKVAQPRLAKQEPRRSIFAFCASSTNVISISRHFRLRKAKCESSAHTHHTCLDFTFLSNLGLFSCIATKKHLCRFLCACTRKYT